MHEATLLESGRVLVTGGTTTDAMAELFDPATGTFTATDLMRSPRLAYTANLLSDGTVLVTGGRATAELASAELFDSVKERSPLQGF
jgi:hypothetical protein